MKQIYDMFNEILVKLFRDIMDIEGKAIITEEFKDISNNDMHIIVGFFRSVNRKKQRYRQGRYRSKC